MLTEAIMNAEEEFQAQLREQRLRKLKFDLHMLNHQIEKQKLLLKLTQIPVCHRNMAKREQIETALKNL